MHPEAAERRRSLLRKIMVTRSIADASMDRRLRQYMEEARRSGLPDRVADAQRAQAIRDNPKFIALVDVVHVAEVPSARSGNPDRTEAVADLLSTASITMEMNPTVRGARAAAKDAVRAILTALRVPDAERLEVTRLILVMAHDWARERARFRARAVLERRQAAS